MNIAFSTFASSNWSEAPKRYKDQLDYISKNFNLFSKSMFFTENELGQEYLNAFSKFFSDHGFAYFSWKPMVLMKSLEQLDEGDLLFYMDGGCTFPMEQLDSFVKEFRNAVDWYSTSDALFGLTSFQEKPFKELPGFPNITIVKKEILSKFGLIENKDFLYFYPHWQAGLVLCRKNKETIDFLKEWYQFFLENYESCVRGEYRDRNGQYPMFIQNGSDQAILQCMLFTKKTKIFPINFIHKYRVIEHIRR